ncbi:MAG: hypothetical protein TEF_12585 [Rhizobiales bacterium NRL2]|mgnify:CR=1 FL=1|jgi:hypothetical protein|nr:MAG: hypothetical protein TEF_03980 [Rhizobiales bacterium NRL2]ANK81534.1 MAG: hypothetical protein TEF_12585 [Rhizobiales bacterium NRL2]
MMTRRAALVLVAGGVLLAACGPTAEEIAAYQPTPVEVALSDGLYRGEWLRGQLYEIRFDPAGPDQRAMIRVIDADTNRTEYNMPAKVDVAGNKVTLRYTEFDRTDHLSFDPERNRLEGHIVFNGERTHRLWAERVE